MNKLPYWVKSGLVLVIIYFIVLVLSFIFKTMVGWFPVRGLLAAPGIVIITSIFDLKGYSSYSTFQLIIIYGFSYLLTAIIVFIIGAILRRLVRGKK